MRARSLALSLTFAVSVLAVRLSAQQPPARIGSGSAVVGSVADGDGNPIDQAEVALLEGDSTVRTVHSDSVGRFRLDGLPGASARLRVRRLGFRERVVHVALTPNSSSPVYVTLESAANTLDAVHVDGAGLGGPSERLREFYDRQHSNRFGYYIDEQRIADLKPERTSDALRGVPGVVVRPSRGIGNEVRIRGCKPLVWVDGMRAQGAELDDLARGPDVAAIEVYSSSAGVPAQYADRRATCGTILVWLKVQ